MKRIRASFNIALLAGAFLLHSSSLLPLQGAEQSGPLTGDKAIEHLKRAGQYDSLGAAITGARYGVKTEREHIATAMNPAHGIFSTFTPAGLRLEVRTGGAADAPVHSVSWRLESLGYGAAQRPVPVGALKTEGARVELVRATPRVTEWFQNSPAGLEHGFTLAERPSANPQGEPLRLVMAVTGDLAPEADATGQSLSLRDAAGRSVVSYARLKVWDATGAELPATMQSGAGCVTLTVSEASARYPLTIDPTFTQQAYLKASNSQAGDFLGHSVAVSGDTVVVGAVLEDSNATGVNGNGSNNNATNSGAAYVFVRNGTTWTQEAYLKAFNTGIDDAFGVSVAVSGDTVVVGAPQESSNATGVNGDGNNNNASGSGAAYVFVRSGTLWSQQAYLKATNTGTFDSFGASVAVSGDTVLVGATGEDSNATGVNGAGSNNTATDSGAAYVFVRSGTNWTQQVYLKSSNTGLGDQFGTSVAVSGERVIVGAPSEDSGATGVDGNQNNDNAPDSGAAYVFVRNGTTWTQQAYLKASNTGTGDRFGHSVAVAGGTVVVGAFLEDSSTTGVNSTPNESALNSGAAYVFLLQTGPFAFGWIHKAYLKANNTGEGDNFGESVAVSSDGTVAVGAWLEDSNATGVNGNSSDNSADGSGAAYVFVRGGGTISNPTWLFRDYLKASNTGEGEQFGKSVAAAGDAVVVGASAPDGSGVASVFKTTTPEIAVEQPLNTNLADGSGQDFVVINGGSTDLTFTIKNTGNDLLTGLTLSVDGTDAAMFTVTATPAAPVLPAGSTTFTVRFAPTSTGTKTAALHLFNNDPDEAPFDITLNGYTLNFTQDTDGDGLNDAAEFRLAAYGFDWKVSQPAFVNNLFSTANGAGLFTLSQVQALHVDTPLLTKDPIIGLFKLTIGVQKATQLTNFFPFPMTAPQTTINAEGKLEFQFGAPDNAAFFRLESR